MSQTVTVPQVLLTTARVEAKLNGSGPMTGIIVRKSDGLVGSLLERSFYSWRGKENALSMAPEWALELARRNLPGGA